MYIIIIAIALILVLLFWETIKIMLTSMTNSNLENGYLWFFCLLAINLIICIFIIWFYYYKINQPGKHGSNGIIGNTGLPGNICNINDRCYQND